MCRVTQDELELRRYGRHVWMRMAVCLCARDWSAVAGDRCLVVGVGPLSVHCLPSNTSVFRHSGYGFPAVVHRQVRRCHRSSVSMLASYLASIIVLSPYLVMVIVFYFYLVSVSVLGRVDLRVI